MAPDKWTRLEMLGAGAFGRVYRAFNSEGKFMAVKQVASQAAIRSLQLSSN